MQAIGVLENAADVVTGGLYSRYKVPVLAAIIIIVILLIYFIFFRSKDGLEVVPEGVYTSGASLRDYGSEFSQPSQGDRETPYVATIMAKDLEAQRDLQALRTVNVGTDSSPEKLTSERESPLFFYTGIENPDYMAQYTREKMTGAREEPPMMNYAVDRLSLAKYSITGQTPNVPPSRGNLILQAPEAKDPYAATVQEINLQQIAY